MGHRPLSLKHNTPSAAIGSSPHLLPRIARLVYAHVNLAGVAAGERIAFSVPSGSSGDTMGAVLARLLGVH